MPDEIGLIGLGRMGRNLAANMMARGIAVRASDRSNDALSAATAAMPGLAPATDAMTLVAGLASPRCVMLLVPAGEAVDGCLEWIAGVLDAGDTVIDAGNSHYRDTERRGLVLMGRGIHFMGLGVSGGPDGARRGPSLMAGGHVAAWERAGPILKAIAAHVDDVPCAAHFGDGGAGHFVKMVHNGIEYAVLQILADVFALLADGCALSAGEVAKAFKELGSGLAAGYLAEASQHVLAAPDGSGDGFLIDAVDDRADQNMTGAWTIEAAGELGCAVPTIAAAAQFRTLSANTGLRGGSRAAAGDRPFRPQLAPKDVTALMGTGVACAMAAAFQQGFTLIEAAGDHFGAALDRGRIAQIWRGGSILRGLIMDRIADAFGAEPAQPTLLGEPGLGPLVANGLEPLRGLAMAALSHGLPAPGLSSAVHYLDALTQDRLSTRFVQLHRDRFGGHGFRRVDDDALRHGPWRRDDDS